MMFILQYIRNEHVLQSCSWLTLGRDTRLPFVAWKSHLGLRVMPLTLGLPHPAQAQVSQLRLVVIGLGALPSRRNEYVLFCGWFFAMLFIPVVKVVSEHV